MRKTGQMARLEDDDDDDYVQYAQEEKALQSQDKKM